MPITPPTQDQFLDLIFSEDPYAVAAALVRQGVKASVRDGVITADNDFLNLRIGLPWVSIDYPTRRTQIGFVLFGVPSWISKRYPTLDAAINKRWTVERKAKH